MLNPQSSILNPNKPRKRFGQHFLHDRSVIAKIVAAIDPRREDRIVEIGPGRGALTGPLLQRVERLDAIEIDRDLAAQLERTYSSERLSVHCQDALKFDFAALGTRLRVVGNLPYNISTPLLFHLVDSIDSIRDCHFMLQREVVERMAARPATSAYGRLSVMLQYRFAMRTLLRVQPGAFSPPPKVESAVVRMTPLSARGFVAADEALFAKLVTAAFTQRRKTLRNALAAYLDEERLRELGIDPKHRAENLDVGEFVAIANGLIG
jgi:16S rRNA (adenine1518-N6/adenine1519-N6)-dimethyltransferase